MKDVKVVFELIFEGCEEQPSYQVCNGIIEVLDFLNSFYYDDTPVQFPKEMKLTQIGSADTYDEGYEVGFEEGKEQSEDIEDLINKIDDARTNLRFAKEKVEELEYLLDDTHEELDI